ncbi:TGS domain-containing protein [bacterium]|nr:TGS domain-containing protein [bacterium]
MPANLTPDYLRNEKNYKLAADQDEKLYWLEQMYSTIPKHKGTEKLQGEIKKKISQLKKSMEGVVKKKSSVSNKIEKSGAAQILVIGPANAGKSTFLTMYTGHSSQVERYAYTTTDFVLGMGDWEDLSFQFIDTPAIKEGFTSFLVFNQLRIADLVIVILTAESDPSTQYEKLTQFLSKKNIQLLASGEKYEQEGTVNLPHMIIMNKIDLIDDYTALDDFRDSMDIKVISTSLILGDDRNEIMEEVFALSRKIRIYTKEQGEKPNMKDPFVVDEGTTVIDLAAHIHKDFVAQFNYARVWGGEFYDGQRIGKTEPLSEGLVIEFYLHD